MEAELEAAFRAVPTWRPEPGDHRIPVEWTMPELVRELAMLRKFKREGASWEATKRKLIAMKKYANALVKDDPFAMADWPMQLRTSVVLIAHAEMPAPPARDTGRPKKDLARKVAQITAERFFQLTGNRPTRITTVEGGKAVQGGKSHGPFIDLLEQVYGILGIEASAASQAKAAIEFVNKKYPQK